MENLFLFKIEVFIFFISLWYIIYYFWDKIFLYYTKIKKIISPKRENIKKLEEQEMWELNEADKKVEENNILVETKIEEKPLILTQEDKDKISEILKRVKINSSKWYFEKAKSLIIEWLTIDKFNKELNLELAWIYEWEKNFKNAEFIYIDLLEHFKSDNDVKIKLWFNLAMQNDLNWALNIYEQVFKKLRTDLWVIEMLCDISYDLKEYQKCSKYLNFYLNEKPRSVEKLFMKWVCLENLWKNTEAIAVYKKILDLQPYNTEARDKLKIFEDNN